MIIHSLVAFFYDICESFFFFSIKSKGQNFVNDDCNRLIPTNSGSNSQSLDTKYAITTPRITRIPAILLIIYSFSIMILFYKSIELFSTSITNAWAGKLFSVS